MAEKNIKIMRPGNEELVVETPVSTMEPYHYSWENSEPKKPASSSARSSLGFGVASMAFSGILGIIFAFVSFAKAGKAKSQGDNSEARKAGVLFGTLGLIGSVAMLAIIACAVIYGVAGINAVEITQDLAAII